ncbi:MAG: abortive infection family protein [Thermoanaerobaculales bacterium]|nr:abortive infection family protein [Thermoanaerobaculales bacterium]
MSDEIALLHSSSAALASSADAMHLIEQKERIQQALANEDPSLVLDTSKAFLESIFKTVLRDRDKDADLSADFTPLFRAVRQELPLSENEDVAGYIQKIAGSIVHNVGEMRNRYGAASHGDDGYHECPVQVNEVELVVQVVVGLAAFVFRRHKESNDPELASRIHYNDYPEFNDFLDTQYGGFELELSDKHHLSIPVSELLFRTDVSAYREMLLQYRSSEEEDRAQDEGVMNFRCVEPVVPSEGNTGT